MNNLILSNKLLYKEIKNYKKLDNHWIGGELMNIKNVILGQRYVTLNFYKSEFVNSFKIPYKLLNYKNFTKNKFIYYDTNLKKLVFNDIIYVWYNQENFKTTKPLQHIYLKKNYIEKNYEINKHMFKKIEQKNLFLLLKKRKMYFLYNSIWLKIYKYKYSKHILKRLLNNLIKKQNILYLKRQSVNKNLLLKSILIGFYNKDIIIYIPKLFKISIIPYQLINNKLNKIIIKHWKNLKKLNMKKKIIKLQFYKYIIYNIFYKVNFKK